MFTVFCAWSVWSTASVLACVRPALSVVCDNRDEATDSVNVNADATANGLVPKGAPANILYSLAGAVFTGLGSFLG